MSPLTTLPECEVAETVVIAPKCQAAVGVHMALNSDSEILWAQATPHSSIAPAAQSGLPVSQNSIPVRPDDTAPASLPVLGTPAFVPEDARLLKENWSRFPYVGTVRPSDTVKMATVSPTDLHRNQDWTPDTSADDLDDFEGQGAGSEGIGYALLRFPDAEYVIKETALVIGRDTYMQNTFQGANRLQVDDKLVKVRQASASSGSDSYGSSDSENEIQAHDDQVKASTLGGIVSDHNILRDQWPTSMDEEVVRCKFLPVHPPIDQDGSCNLGNISKKHLKISMDEDRGWQVEVLGRNGAWVNGIYWLQDALVSLKSSSSIAIASLVFTFHCEDEDESETSSSEGSSEESSSSDESPDNAVDASGPSFGPNDGKDIRTKLKISKSKLEAALKSSITRDGSRKKSGPIPEQLLRPGETMPTRKGPGRPPANGVMSKREMRERIKASKAAGEPLPDHAINGESSKSAKVTNNAKKEKPTKKRKRADSKELVKTGTREDADTEKQEEEIARSPSPQLEDYTEEQLQQPKHLTYQAMIYGILKDKQTEALTLQQIYRAMKRKFPYYKFKVETTGWESSIRHTVAQKYFQKVEKDGKGWRYTINPEEREPQTKPKATPAVAHPQHYARGPYNTLPQGAPRPMYYPANGLPRPSVYPHSYPQPQYGSHGQNTMNGQRPMPVTRPPYQHQYQPPSGSNSLSTPATSGHHPGASTNGIPTHIPRPGQSSAQQQAPLINRPSGQSLTDSQNVNVGLAGSSLQTIGGPTTLSSASATPSTVQKPAGSLSEHGPPLSSPTEAPKPDQKSHSDVTPSIPSRTAASPAQSGPTSSATPNQNPQSARKVEVPSSATLGIRPTVPDGQTSATPSRPNNRVPPIPSDLELYLSGTRPLFFDRMKKNINRTEDMQAFEGAANWMMANSKKLEASLRDSADDSDIPELKTTAPGVNTYVKVIRQFLRKYHAEALKKRGNDEEVTK